MDIKAGSIGAEGSYDVQISEGSLVLSVAYKGADAGANLSLSLPVRAFLDKLTVAIPGTLDDSVIKALELALGL